MNSASKNGSFLARVWLRESRPGMVRLYSKRQRTGALQNAGARFRSAQKGRSFWTAPVLWRFHQPRTPALRAGMTVLELLVVIAIIALLSVLSVPAIRALTRSNTISSANPQLLDDIALARQRAINEHSIVHVLFVQTNVLSMNLNTKNPQNGKVLGNLMTGGQTRYALYAERTAGDQPGQHHPRYLTGWHTLPEGVFFADRPEDTPPGGLSHLEKFRAPFFPTLTGGPMDLPHIAFDDSGALVDVNGNRRPEGEYIELARGSIMFQRDGSGTVIFFDAREIPPRNSVDNYN